MTVLHERIKFAIEIRKIIAEAATPAEVEWEADVHHLLANSPDRIIRDCTEDLMVLTRHAQVNGMAELEPTGEYCARCSHLNQIGEPYPCPEVLSLVRRYNMTAGEQP